MNCGEREGCVERHGQSDLLQVVLCVNSVKQLKEDMFNNWSAA